MPLELKPVEPTNGTNRPPDEISGADRIKEIAIDYLSDESRMPCGEVTRVMFPRSEIDLVRIFEDARSTKTPVTVSSGRTGISGGAVAPCGWAVSLERMNQVRAVKKVSSGWHVRVESGISIDDFKEMVTKKRLDRCHEDIDCAGFRDDPQPLLYPPDPTEGTAHLGGTVATNASGARTYFYGPTRSYVMGLRVVLPTGTVLDLSRGESRVLDDGTIIIPHPGGEISFKVPTYSWPPTKSTAGIYSSPGMDPLDLFIGSEGILGVITSMDLLAIPAPTNVFSIVAFFPSDIDALNFIRSARDMDVIKPRCLEFFDSRSLNMLKGSGSADGASISGIPEKDDISAVYFEEDYQSEEDLETSYGHWDALLEQNGSSMDRTWGGLEDQERRRLKDFRHALPELVNDTISKRKQTDDRIHKVATDMAVPDDRLVEVFQMYRTDLVDGGYDHVIFGHAGDNHFHVNIIPRDHREVIRAKELYNQWAVKVVSWGGSVSGEHGIGRLKKDYLKIQLGEDGIDQIRHIKRALDPGWILNPGVMIDP